MVSEWLAPLCSASGATTHTSSESVRAIFSSSSRPVAWMPSSLLMRMRAFDRSIGPLAIDANGLLSAEVGSERRRHGDRAVSSLIILQDGDQRAADGDAGAVQRVHEARALLAGRAEARAHA